MGEPWVGTGVWKAEWKSSVSLPPATLLMLPAATLLRLLLRWVRRPLLPVIRLWRRNIQLKVVVTTLLMSLGVVLLLGFVVIGQVRNGLLEAKVKASQSQATGGFAVAKQKADEAAAGTSDDGTGRDGHSSQNVISWMSELVLSLSSGGQGAFDVVTLPTGDESGGGRGPRSRQERGQDALLRVEVELDEVIFGVHRDLEVDTAVVCDTCQGSCAQPGTSAVTCDICRGSGSIQRQVRSLLGNVMTSSPCGTCRGYGTVIPNPCPTCQGQGRVRARRSIPIDIPAGVDTGLRLPHRVDTTSELAALWKHHRALGRREAVLVVQPPPADTALPRAVVDGAVADALADAARHGVAGPGVTPFLLAAVERATSGRSLVANLALLEANARLAAEVAVALAG